MEIYLSDTIVPFYKKEGVYGQKVHMLLVYIF